MPIGSTAFQSPDASYVGILVAVVDARYCAFYFDTAATATKKWVLLILLITFDHLATPTGIANAIQSVSRGHTLFWS